MKISNRLVLSVLVIYMFLSGVMISRIEYGIRGLDAFNRNDEVVNSWEHRHTRREIYTLLEYVEELSAEVSELSTQTR